MSRPDVSVASRPATTRRARLSGWGRGPETKAWVASPVDGEEVLTAVMSRPGDRSGPAADAGVIARGSGRSYGDAAQLTNGLVLDMTSLRGHELDPESGVVVAWAGETIGDLLRALVPQGWILPVVPGTQHVTVGGAIASDVHGKNHGAAGTFARHVTSLALLLSSGEVAVLRPAAEDRRFEATVGGMGLTGIILWATIALRRVTGTRLSIETERVGDLDGAFKALLVGDAEYRVAWLDLLGPRAARAARGVVTRARHITGDGGGPPAARLARFGVPPVWPGGLLRPTVVRAVNGRRFAMAPRRAEERPGHFGAEMFPLDAIDFWPRLYGSAGLIQHQFVVPTGKEDVVAQVIERVRHSRVPCFLAVLKRFGPANASPLSFPLDGWTLAMDMPRGASDLPGLVRILDELVANAGGRIYLTKDALLAPDMLRAMYPRLGEWQGVRDSMDPDRRWRSDLGIRTGLVDAS
jgi:decaprenylphospho-beta-D-ribofuranose 2-oxidase